MLKLFGFVVSALWVLPQLSLVVLAQKNPNFVGNRTSIVHLFEWTWPAIAEECENFLQHAGYGGVQISPPNEVIVSNQGAWWERYQPISYILKSHSGDEAQLQDMIDRCNRVGVRIYVDIVINHMRGWAPGVTHGTAGSTAIYDAKEFPAVPYGPGDFNVPCQISDYQNVDQVRNCQLSSLLDLDQSKPHVREMIVGYLNKLADMGVAGFRVDAAKHMWPEDLRAIYDQLGELKEEHGFEKGARPYIYQEVIDLGGEPVKKTEYVELGDVLEFKYSAELGRLFRSTNELNNLKSWGPGWGMLPSNDAVVFVDNHDNQRGHGAGGTDILTYKNDLLYRMASVFMLAHPYGHVTRVMSSYAFDNSDQGPPTSEGLNIRDPVFQDDFTCNTELSGWVCEHRWPEISRMVAFRNVVGDTLLENWWDNERNQIAFARGDMGFVAINMTPEETLQATLQTGLPAGVYCDAITGVLINEGTECTGSIYTVDDTGKVEVNLPNGPSAMAIHVGVRFESVALDAE